MAEANNTATTIPPSAKDTTDDLVATIYEPLVNTARHRFDASSAMQQLTTPTVDAVLLDRFLIQFCASGVGMTKSVEGWIRRAGERCRDIGLISLGDALGRHAEQEAGHHELMISDTRSLVRLWNNLGRAHLDADELLANSDLPGVRMYAELHEATIVSEAPFGQLAIEYEIERLSLTAGVRLMANVRTVCGPDRLSCLSFLAHHIGLDQGHTEFNRRQLNALLAAYPAFASDLGTTGSTALDAYSVFLNDCLDAAQGNVAGA